MDRAAAIAEIKRGTGFRPTQDPTIIAALQSAQRTLEMGRTLPNFLLVFDASIAVTANDPNITLPSNFLRLSDEYELYYTNTDGARIFIPRRNYTEAYQAFVASGDEDGTVIQTTSSYPQVWVHRSDTTGLLVPTPTVSFTAKLTYYKAAQVLDTNIENEWLAKAPEVMIGLAGIQVAGVLRDKDALSEFTRRYKMGQGSLMGKIVEDELAGRGLVMGRNN